MFLVFYHCTQCCKKHPYARFFSPYARVSPRSMPKIGIVKSLLVLGKLYKNLQKWRSKIVVEFILLDRIYEPYWFFMLSILILSVLFFLPIWWVRIYLTVVLIHISLTTGEVEHIYMYSFLIPLSSVTCPLPIFQWIVSTFLICLCKFSVSFGFSLFVQLCVLKIFSVVCDLKFSMKKCWCHIINICLHHLCFLWLKNPLLPQHHKESL